MVDNESIDKELLANSNVSYQELATLYGCTREWVRVRAMTLGFARRKAVGPFYRVCIVCGDSKQVKTLKGVAKYCKRHAIHEVPPALTVETQPCSSCNARETLTGRPRVDYVRNRERFGRMGYTCSGCKIKNGGYFVTRGKKSWIIPLKTLDKIALV